MREEDEEESLFQKRSAACPEYLSLAVPMIEQLDVPRQYWMAEGFGWGCVRYGHHLSADGVLSLVVYWSDARSKEERVIGGALLPVDARLVKMYAHLRQGKGILYLWESRHTRAMVNLPGDFRIPSMPLKDVCPEMSLLSCKDGMSYESSLKSLGLGLRYNCGLTEAQLQAFAKTHEQMMDEVQMEESSLLLKKLLLSNSSRGLLEALHPALNTLFVLDPLSCSGETTFSDSQLLQAFEMMTLCCQGRLQLDPRVLVDVMCKHTLPRVREDVLLWKDCMKCIIQSMAEEVKKTVPQ